MSSVNPARVRMSSRASGSRRREVHPERLEKFSQRGGQKPFTSRMNIFASSKIPSVMPARFIARMDQGCVVPNAHGLKMIIGKINTPLKSSQTRWNWTSAARRVSRRPENLRAFPGG